MVSALNPSNNVVKNLSVSTDVSVVKKKGFKGALAHLKMSLEKAGVYVIGLVLQFMLIVLQDPPSKKPRQIQRLRKENQRTKKKRQIKIASLM